MGDVGLTPSLNPARQPTSRGAASRPTSPPLRSIDEDATFSAPPIPAKSVLRQTVSDQFLPHFIPPSAPSANYEYKNSNDTGRSAPPAYEWRAQPLLVDEVHNGPVEGEKLAAYRRADGYKRKQHCISWRRSTLIIAAVVVLLVIGLIVGLAVGLTVGRKGSKGKGGGLAGPSETSSPQPFPLGQFSMITALRTVNSSCTSNAETWNCYPYQIYDAANPDSGKLTFNWVIANSSSSYATIDSGTTSDEGEPANLTISATGNPFSVTFNNTPLTYISPASNTSSARYTFKFDMSKAFNPPVSLASNNVATQCFYNQTTFTGTLYLSATRTYPAPNSSDDALQWPYAIDIQQSSPGGADVPACYEYIQGQVGARITTGLILQPTDTQCLCDYRNY